ASVRRRLFGTVYLARSPCLLPASRNSWLWRSHCARRLHAARPGGRLPLGVQAGLEGLAFSQLSPGPLAAQLAMYLGWLRAGAIGATLGGIAFILPSFLMALVLAALYVHFGSFPRLHGMFFGIVAPVRAATVAGSTKRARE